MVMLVIFVIGSLAFLVASLDKATVKNERNRNTATALAMAKDALIARAVSDASSPGSLPCPDITGDGVAQTATDCTYYIGRLPWKTLGLPRLTDSHGQELWYALSRNFRDDSSNNPLNSDSSGDLIISGSPSANNVIAIVFAPGPNLNGQSRSSNSINCLTTGNSQPENLCAASYLEGSNANLDTKTNLNVQFVADDATDTFNDQLIYIINANLLPSVEKRIAREVKQCLDDYAAISSEKYPWAAPVSSMSYTSTTNTRFGRIPTVPQIFISGLISGDSGYSSLMSKLNALDNAEQACRSNDNLQSALTNAANQLLTFLNTLSDPPYSATFINQARAAASAALPGNSYSQPCDYIDNHSVNQVRSNLNQANSTLGTLDTQSPQDSTMSDVWPASCKPLPASSYWNAWRNLVFYEVHDHYRPNGSKSCGATASPNCMTIIGNASPEISPSPRAAVLIAGKNLNTIVRNPANLSDYLEGINSAVPATGTLETYKLEDQADKQINDVIVCADGLGRNQYSKCK